jgi:hypothetical protein
MNLPPVVSEEECQAAREALLVKEKEATRARDALAAERRRLPMVRIDKDYVFDGPDGNATLLDLFEGRRQLLLYHFMFGPNQDAGCDGSSMFVPEAPGSRCRRSRPRDRRCPSRLSAVPMSPLRLRQWCPLSPRRHLVSLCQAAIVDHSRTRGSKGVIVML